MRIKYSFFVVLALIAQSAYALKTPSPDEINDIQKQIYAANKMDKPIGDATELFLKARREKQSDERIRALEKQIEILKEKQNAARTKAIHMTILAYDIAPTDLRGTSVLPLTKGREIGWLPVARERESRHIQDASGKSHRLGQPREDLAGKVYADGVAYIYPQAFGKGVGYLASTLLHERVHFEQITSKGRGDKMRRAESEVEAYQAEKDNERYFFVAGIPADDAEMAATAAKLDEEKKEAEQVKKERAALPNRLRDLFGTPTPPDMFESRIHTNAELADISGLVAQARSQAAISRRDREEREALTRAAEKKSARREHDERLKNAYAELARRSCDSPGSVSQAELDALPKPLGTDVMNTMPPGLDDCSGNAYLMLFHGTTADQLQARSVKKGPAAITPDLPPTPPSDPTPIRGRRVAAFSTMLPAARHLSVTACASPDRVTIDAALTTPPYDIAFSPRNDDQVAVELSAGLGECESRLFRRLIEVIRNGEGPGISVRWVQETAAAFRPAPVYYPPPSGRRCEDYGNIRCPH